MTTKPEFILRIRALARPGDANDPGAWRRLRATVKFLLRSFGWRVVSYSEVKGTTSTEGSTDE